jgi:hypothetical protein
LKLPRDADDETIAETFEALRASLGSVAQGPLAELYQSWSAGRAELS